MKWKSYDHINHHFEAAIQKLQDNLNYLKEQGNVSQAFISIQTKIIEALINYQHQTEYLISEIEWDMFETAKTKELQFKKLKDHIISLEAICIIHGIMDFPVWMNKGKNYLVSHAVEEHHKKRIQLPSLLHEQIQKLRDEEQDTIHKLLNKRWYQEIQELENQIKALNPIENESITHH